MIHPARSILYSQHSNSDAFARLQSSAHEAATGLNSRPEPTEAQQLAGNYKKGRITIHGLPLRIENVRNSVREGTSEGKRWSNRLAAHYGEIAGTVGNDGDPIDVFVGLFPESTQVWVINQRFTKAPNEFDEHKVMLGFASLQQAGEAYQLSFDREWNGLESIYPCSISEFKWWLQHGNKSLPFTPDQLPFEGKAIMDQVMQKVLWSNDALPVTTQLPKLMYDLRVHDKDDGFLLDAVTMEDLLSHPDIDEAVVLDALVVEVNRMTVKMELLKRVMDAAGVAVKPVNMTISDPVRARGVLQVMVLFEMNDGQTIAIWFHNPDTTPARLTPMDELISWKWMLNKKDVTIVVAPERGKDLNVREVARRVMRLVERNSENFKKANAKSAERVAETEAVKSEIVALETELAQVNRKIEVARMGGAVSATAVPKVIAPEAEAPAAGDGATDAAFAEAGVAPDDIAAMTDDGGYPVIMADERLQLKWQDVLDASLQERGVAVLNALRKLGWGGVAGANQISKNGADITVAFKLVGAGKNAVQIHYMKSGAYEGESMISDDFVLKSHEMASKIDASVRGSVGTSTPLSDAVVKALNALGAEAVTDLTTMIESEPMNGANSALIKALVMAKGAAAQENRAQPEQDAEFAAYYEVDREKLAAAMNDVRAELAAVATPVVPATVSDVSKLFSAGSISAAYALWQSDLAGEEELDLTSFADMWWSDHGQAELWTLPGKVVKGWTDEEYQAAYDALENWNFHPEALVLMAKRLGNAGDAKEAMDILKNQRSEGSATTSIMDRRVVLGKKLRGESVVAETAAPAAKPDPQVAVLAELVKLGWEDMGSGFVGKIIGGGMTGGMVNKEGDRRFIANFAQAGVLVAKFGDDTKATVMVGIGADPEVPAKELDDLVNAMDPRQVSVNSLADVPLSNSTAASALEALSRMPDDMSKAAAALNFYVELASSPSNKLGWSRLKQGYTLFEGVTKTHGDDGRMLSAVVRESDFVIGTTAQNAISWAVSKISAMLPSAADVDATRESVNLPAPLPEGWTESTPGGMATSTDPVTGGIVDKQKVSGEWFVIPENDAITNMKGFATRDEAFAMLAKAVASVTKTVQGDISYRADDMFTSFMPDSKAGEEAWKIINANPESEGGKVLNQHAESVIAQLRAAGYVVNPMAPTTESGDDLLKALAEPGAEAAAETRLAVDLSPAAEAPVDPAALEAQKLAEIASSADVAYLNTLIDGSADLFATDIMDKLEPMFAKYEADPAMMELLTKASNAYSDNAIAAARTAMAG